MPVQIWMLTVIEDQDTVGTLIDVNSVIKYLKQE
jgi:hypothetical protein